MQQLQSILLIDITDILVCRYPPFHTDKTTIERARSAFQDGGSVKCMSANSRAV